MDIYGIGCKPIYPVLSSSYLSCNICACVWVRVCACVWGQTWLREEDTWCDRLGTESGRKAEENVFPQRDCVQKPENCNLRYEYITQLLVIGRVNVMQQRLLAPRSLADCDWGGASFSADTKKKKKNSYLRCHNACLPPRVCANGGFAPSSAESLLLTFTSIGRGPARAAAGTCPFPGILAPSQSISQTRGKVFKLDLKTQTPQMLRTLAFLLEPDEEGARMMNIPAFSVTHKQFSTKNLVKYRLTTSDVCARGCMRSRGMRFLCFWQACVRAPLLERTLDGKPAWRRCTLNSKVCEVVCEKLVGWERRKRRRRERGSENSLWLLSEYSPHAPLQCRSRLCRACSRLCVEDSHTSFEEKAELWNEPEPEERERVLN